MSEDHGDVTPGVEPLSVPPQPDPFERPVPPQDERIAQTLEGLALTPFTAPTAELQVPLPSEQSSVAAQTRQDFPKRTEGIISQFSATSLPSLDLSTLPPSSRGSSSKAGIIVFIISVLFIISSSIVWAYYAIGAASSFSFTSWISGLSWFSEEDTATDLPTDEDFLSNERWATHPPSAHTPPPVPVEEEAAPYVIPDNSWSQGHETVWEMKDEGALLYASHHRIYTYGGYPLTISAWDISGFNQPQKLWAQQIEEDAFIRDPVDVNGKLYVALMRSRNGEESVISFDTETGHIEESPLAESTKSHKYRNVFFEKDYYLQCETEEAGHTTLLGTMDDIFALRLRNGGFQSCTSYNYENQELWSFSPSDFVHRSGTLLLNLDNGHRVELPENTTVMRNGVYFAKTHQIIPLLSREENGFRLELVYPDGSSLGNVTLLTESSFLAPAMETSFALMTRKEAEYLIDQEEIKLSDALTYLGYITDAEILLRGGTSAKVPDTLHYRVSNLFYSADEKSAIAYSYLNAHVSWFGNVHSGQTYTPVLDNSFDEQNRLVRPDLLIVKKPNSQTIQAIAPKNR